MTIRDLRAYPYEWKPQDKVSLDGILQERERYRRTGQRVVTTNGCFELLHPGHIQFLLDARSLGDVLIVGLNGDASVRRLKGEGHPLLSEQDRAFVLSALRSVDHILVFDDALPNAWLALVQPDIHCKAADYSAETLPEAPIVRAHGGQVMILPLRPGHSTSQLTNKILELGDSTVGEDDTVLAQARHNAAEELLAGANVLRQTAYALRGQLDKTAALMKACLISGGQLLICGNGGSAADAQHLAAELVGRFRRERQPLAAVALTTDSSILTAIGNDYDFAQVFSRQIEAIGRPGDMLIAISTSGSSNNILEAARAAKNKKMTVVALTGARRSPLENLADVRLAVPSENTAFIQQCHIAVEHVLCELVERNLSERKADAL